MFWKFGFILFKVISFMIFSTRYFSSNPSGLQPVGINQNRNLSIILGALQATFAIKYKC